LRSPQSRIWVPFLAALLVVVLAIADGITGEAVIIVPLYVIGPLLAAVAASPRATAAVAVLATVLGAVMLIVLGDAVGQDLVRLATVVLGSALAVWIAILRTRLRTTAGLLDVTFEHAPVGLALLDSGGRYVRVNDRLAAINGVPAAAHAGRTIGELLPDLPPQVADDVVRVARTGQPLIDVEVSAQTDRYEALLLALSDAGEGLLVLERDGRCVYANSAFEQLSGYTSPELVAMETVLDLAVEYDIPERRQGAIARLDEGIVTPALPLTLRRRDGGLVDLEVGGVRLNIEGRRQLVVVVRDVTERRRAEAEREKLLAERDHVARTLQQSLLPRALPAVPGVELAARYLAAGEGNEVGGDFYDCYATGGGDWALVVGDVCGKGAEAAALTALARYTLRAASQHTRRPRAVLTELNEALLRDRQDYRFCTVVYVSLTPRDDRVSACVAAAGHPLPLVLRAEGDIETVGSPGSLLGIVDTPELVEERVELMPGDALVLYTDGVTEADRAAGPERLAAVLEGCRGVDAAAIAAAVEADALAAHGGLARDDVAVVVVRPRGPAQSFGPAERGVATAT
jgi:PAS domain S-box-containing protein